MVRSPGTFELPAPKQGPSQGVHVEIPDKLPICNTLDSFTSFLCCLLSLFSSSILLFLFHTL